MLDSKRQTQNHHWLAREGWGIIAVSFFVWVFLREQPIWSWLSLGWFIFCLYFFRNPTRQAHTDEWTLVSPADGKILAISTAIEPEFLKQPMQRITIFMSPLDVHVNRIPANGTVEGLSYHKGQFKPAYEGDASETNERSSVFFKTNLGREIVFTQIAGWLARRIFTYVKTGENLTQSQIFGMIRFGSRMDVWVGLSDTILVKVGDSVKAGESLLVKMLKSPTGGA